LPSVYRLELALVGRLFSAEDPEEELEALEGYRFRTPAALQLHRAIADSVRGSSVVDPGEVAAALAGVIPVPYATISDALSAAADIAAPLEELRRVKEGEADREAPPPLFPVAVVPPGSMLEHGPLELPEEVLPGIPRGSISFLHAPEGAGKTSLALQLALAKATGTPWIGRPVGGPGPVLFLAQESSPPELQARTLAIARELDLDLPGAGLAFITERELSGRYIDLRRDGERLERTILELEAGPAELVIVDHLSALSPDERDLGQHRATEELHRIAVTTGAALLILDHDNKAGLGERSAHAGRALKRRAAAATLWLGMERGIPFLEVGKGRYLSAEERARVWLRWRSLPDPWGRSSAGRPVSWGYLEPGPAPANGSKEGPSPELEGLIPDQWTGTREIVEEAARHGLMGGLEGEAAGRSIRRALERLHRSGRVEKDAGRGRAGSRWRRKP